MKGNEAIRFSRDDLKVRALQGFLEELEASDPARYRRTLFVLADAYDVLCNVAAVTDTRAVVDAYHGIALDAGAFLPVVVNRFLSTILIHQAFQGMDVWNLVL